MVSSTKSELIEVVTTTETRKDAEKIAELLVRGKMAACAQVSGPVKSLYWWEGRLESSEEWVCTAKTIRIKYEETEREIRRVHPYEVPQIIALPITGALEEYAAWIRDNTGS